MVEHKQTKNKTKHLNLCGETRPVLCKTAQANKEHTQTKRDTNPKTCAVCATVAFTHCLPARVSQRKTRGRLAAGNASHRIMKNGALALRHSGAPFFCAAEGVETNVLKPLKQRWQGWRSAATKPHTPTHMTRPLKRTRRPWGVSGLRGAAGTSHLHLLEDSGLRAGVRACGLAVPK